MNLSAIFRDVVHKRLVAVEMPHGISNGHELNGVRALQEFFGVSEPVSGDLHWHYFADDEEPSESPGTFTFYDARAKSAHRTGRSEWRFYYYGDFLSRAAVGDWLFLARSVDGRLFALVLQDGSAWLRAAQALFGVEQSQSDFDSVGAEQLSQSALDLLHRQILDALGLEIVVPASQSDEQLMMETFRGVFPSTAEMSNFARLQVDLEGIDPDATLLRWLDREEQLFRAMEAVLIRARLQNGFATVDDFLTYSLSVQQRRKSRMGLSLQHHLTQIFTAHGLYFTPQCQTEGKSKPDFIFPSYKAYHDPHYEESLLVMLGVKSSSKERWRQVLDEADRIKRKHLCTLDQAISTSQSDSMNARRLKLVVPAGYQTTYTPDQRSNMLSVGAFINYVKALQTS